jgi:hypothetical protein
MDEEFDVCDAVAEPIYAVRRRPAWSGRRRTVLQPKRRAGDRRSTDAHHPLHGSVKVFYETAAGQDRYAVGEGVSSRVACRTAGSSPGNCASRSAARSVLRIAVPR